MKNQNIKIIMARNLLLFVALIIWACGDNSSSAESSETSSSSETDCDGAGCVTSACTDRTVFVFGTDYKAGELRWIEEKAGHVAVISEDKLDFYQDSKIINAGGNFFVLERAGADNLTLLDPCKKEVLWQTALEDYSNPTDVVMADESSAWVALEGTQNFVKVSVADGKILKTVKTDAFTSKGGTSPNLADFAVRGDTLFAIFQRYVYDAATYTSAYPKGLLAWYDLKTGELLDTLSLATKNPAMMAATSENLYVATQGEYDEMWSLPADENRGIEKVDLTKKKSSLFVTGVKLGGGATDITVDEKNALAYVAVSVGFSKAVVSVNMKDGSVKELKDISGADGGFYFDAKSGLLYTGDRTFGDVLFYDGKDVLVVEKGDVAPLPPYGITVSGK